MTGSSNSSAFIKTNLVCGITPCRIGIGKVDNGCLKINQDAVVVNHHDPDKQKKVKISKLYEFSGLGKVDVKEAGVGSIVAISGCGPRSRPGRKRR